MRKMKGKRLLSLLLTLCMGVSLVPATAFAAEPETETVLICTKEEHSHVDKCYYISCGHEDGHIPACYGTAEAYALCEHENESDHAGTVTLADVVTINGTDANWKTEHPAYGAVYAVYKDAYEKAYEEAYKIANTEVYAETYDATYKTTYAGYKLAFWMSEAEKVAAAEAAAKAAAEAAAEFAKEKSCEIADLAGKTAGVAILADKTFCYTIVPGTNPDQCTHTDGCSEVGGSCYTLKCTKEVYAHSASCYATLVKTTLKLNAGVELTYGFDEDALLDALVVGVYDSTNTEITAGEVVVDTDIENLNVGDAVEVTLKYEGVKNAYAPAEATATIKINKAPATVNVNNVTVRYGETYDLGIAAKSESGKNVSAITFVAGLDMANMQILNGEVVFPETVVNVTVPPIKILGYELELPSGKVSLTDAIEILETLMPASEYVTGDQVNQVIEVLEELQEKFGEVTVMFNGAMPEHIGVYLVGAVTADANYETAMGVGTLVITPDGHRAELDWNVHDENGAIALTAIDTYDLGAHVTKLYEVPADMTEEAAIAAAANEIEYLYAGVNLDGEIVLTQDLKAEDTLTGAYAEVAAIVNWGNEMYYSMPIVRTLVVVPELADVTFKDVNENNAFRFTYGEEYELKVLVDGSESYDGDVTITYVGVTADGEVYHSTEAPAKAGAYTATALYSEKEDGEVVKAGIAVAAMVIEKQDSDFALINKEVTYTPGVQQFVGIHNPKGVDDILYVIVNEDPNTEATNVNVIIPEALKVMVPELGDKESLSTIPAKEAITKLIAKVENAKLPEGLVMPEGFVTELNKALGEVKDVLVKVPNATVTINGDKPVDCGTYNVYAVTFSRNVKSDYAEAVLTINHAYASKWTAGEAEHWHAATCGHDVVADKAAHGYDTNGNCVCGAHQHTYSTTWTYDGANHWNAVTCGHAVDVANKAAHNFGNDRTCDTCGYTYSSGDNPGNPGGTNPGGGGVGGGGSAAKPEGPVGGGGGGGSDDEEGMVLGAEEVAAVNFLNTTDHIVYMVGDDKGNFRPEASVTRAEVAQIFYNLLINKDVPITATFADVPENQWYAKAVNTLASMGILSGVGDNMYEPTRMITRAEFAVIAAKFVDAVQADSNFADVPESHWAYGSISTAATYGWIAGVGDNMYAPSRAIKRVEAATIVNNMLGRMGDHDKIDAGLCRQFPDVSETHWGRYQIAEATTDHDYSFDEYRTIETWID